jgi:hypothetical protein
LRREALTLSLVSKDGEPFECIAFINRDGNAVSLGETVIMTEIAAFNFAPFYQAWGRLVPSAWIQASAAMLRHEKSE